MTFFSHTIDDFSTYYSMTFFHEYFWHTIDILYTMTFIHDIFNIYYEFIHSTIYYDFFFTKLSTYYGMTRNFFYTKIATYYTMTKKFFYDFHKFSTYYSMTFFHEIFTKIIFHKIFDILFSQNVRHTIVWLFFTKFRQL